MGEPPEGQLNGAVSGGGGGGGLMIVAASETVGSKRQRRPSVRLGDIGGDHHHHHQPYESHVRRITSTSTSNAAAKQFRNHHHVANFVDHRKDASKSSKVRALTNLNSNSGELNETLDENLDSIAIGSWKVKDSKKRGSTKRARTNWVSKNNETGGDNNNKNDDVNNNNNNNFEVADSEEDLEDGYREFNMENSESPLKEQSPVHSLDNLAVDGHGRDNFYCNRRGPIRGSRDHNDGMELSGPSDNDAREWNRGGSEDGVRIWLNSLGLGRYAPVFEVHEVDDEVLPMLTLEDLKDMGINAVGSRRKMYCAIQKLGKGFS